MQESPYNALNARKLLLPAHTTDQLGCIVAFEYLEAPSLPSLPPPVRACVCMCLAQNRSTIGETARSKKRRERSRTRSSSSSNAIRDSWDSEFRIQNSESELSRIALSIAANAATGEGDGSGGERGKREKEIARIPVRSDTRALPFEPSRVPLLSSPNYHSRSSCVGARTSDSSFLPLSLSLSLV